MTRLASDIIAIKHGNVAVRLRPSLRAALTLHSRHGLPAVLAGIMDRNFGIMVDVIVQATDEATAYRIGSDLTRDGLFKLDHLVEPLTDYVFALLGNDREPATKRTTARVQPTTDWIAPYIEDLFEKATGWLGWSAHDAWAATPREIQTATRGLIAKLKAIHGTADDKPAYDPLEAITPAEVSEGIARLRQLSANQ